MSAVILILKEILGAVTMGLPVLDAISQRINKLFLDRELTVAEKAELDALLAEAAEALAHRVPLTQRYPDPVPPDPSTED